jgi:hypothetical protein
MNDLKPEHAVLARRLRQMLGRDLALIVGAACVVAGILLLGPEELRQMRDLASGLLLGVGLRLVTDHFQLLESARAESAEDPRAELDVHKKAARAASISKI